MSVAINPLPSLIRASAWDAGNNSMRRANRTKWNDDDWNAAAELQERLIRNCYGFRGDNSDRCYIRFSYAEHLEREGVLRLTTKSKEFFAAVDHYEKAMDAHYAVQVQPTPFVDPNQTAFQF